MKKNLDQMRSLTTKTFSYLLSPLFLLSLSLLLSGCLTMKAYVDPQFRDATYQSIQNTDAPLPVDVSVEFQFNGKTMKRQKDIVQRKVVRVLNSTRIFTEVDSTNTQAGKLEIYVNNVGNIGDAIGKGMATGFTFGLAGSHVIDGYEMTCIYTPPSNSAITKKYKHALHSTIGLHAELEGMEPVPFADAFDQVVEEMLLNFLHDLQKENLI